MDILEYSINRGQEPLNNNWDGGATSEYLWFKAGGDSRSTIRTGKTFTLNQPSQPEIGKLDYDVKSMYYENEKLKFIIMKI